MKKLALIAFTIVLGIFTLVAFTFKTATGGYEIGDKAQDFKLKDIDGKMKSLASIGGAKAKGYIVVFTCNHCPFAIANEDRLIALDKKYKSKGFPVIAINPNAETHSDDTYDLMKSRAKEKGFTFPYLADFSQKVTKQFGASKTPHFYLLDKKMTVRYIGALDDSPRDESGVSKNFLTDAVEAIITGKEVKKTTAAAVGCTIKWKK